MFGKAVSFTDSSFYSIAVNSLFKQTSWHRNQYLVNSFFLPPVKKKQNPERI